MCLCLEVVVAVVVVVGEEPIHLPCADAIAMDSFCGPIMASKTSTHGEEGELLLLPFLSSSPLPQSNQWLTLDSQNVPQAPI